MMAKRKKVYCENCIHFSRQKKNEVRCAKAVTVTVAYSATYLHPDIERKEYCWEKNEKNKCRDYEEKIHLQ